jgi:hypothetical protein
LAISVPCEQRFYTIMQDESRKFQASSAPGVVPSPDHSGMKLPCLLSTCSGHTGETPVPRQGHSSHQRFVEGPTWHGRPARKPRASSGAKRVKLQGFASRLASVDSPHPADMFFSRGRVVETMVAPSRSTLTYRRASRRDGGRHDACHVSRAPSCPLHPPSRKDPRHPEHPPSRLQWPPDPHRLPSAAAPARYLR